MTYCGTQVFRDNEIRDGPSLFHTCTVVIHREKELLLGEQTLTVEEEEGRLWRVLSEEFVGLL